MTKIHVFWMIVMIVVILLVNAKNIECTERGGVLVVGFGLVCVEPR